MPEHYLIFETAGGFCGIAWSEAGITRFQLPTRSPETTERQLRRRLPRGRAGRAAAGGRRGRRGGPALLRRRADRLRRPRARPRRPGPVLRPGLRRRPRRSAGARPRPTARSPRRSAPAPRRPATSARRWRRNPVALIIPCHRVLAAGGKLGGFSAPGGAATKRRMLELEGVGLAPSRRRSRRCSRRPQRASTPRGSARAHRSGLRAQGWARVRNLRRQVKLLI